MSSSFYAVEGHSLVGECPPCYSHCIDDCPSVNFWNYDLVIVAMHCPDQEEHNEYLFLLFYEDGVVSSSFYAVEGHSLVGECPPAIAIALMTAHQSFFGIMT